ncbi:VOC family protein [Nakamurella antarctica]|uniref:VOC family protein n=1 Tax=Nakamurella antarctica TaxID=1902245 RepID=A0A3G8ZNL2_9ACTN|nr:VOC family protein [Nakamurella antarctica]AZI58850.1 VOC family protein [Nakamurella antarctica]
MPTRDTPFKAGTPCWADLFTSDADKSRSFYHDVMGWTADEPNPAYGGYVNFRAGGSGSGKSSAAGHRAAGMMGGNTTESPVPDMWTLYFSVDDIDAVVAKAVGLGARVRSGPHPVGDLGSMAVLTDPSGGAFGLWQGGIHPGFSHHLEPGSAAWFEYHATDFASGTAFYAALFEWELSVLADSDEFRYTNAQVAGEDVVGLMDSRAMLPAGHPPFWTIYFSVADMDSALGTVVELGGSIEHRDDDSPYGRTAAVVDSTGARVKLHCEAADH